METVIWILALGFAAQVALLTFILLSLNHEK